MKTLGVAVVGLTLVGGVLGDGDGQRITTYFHECPEGYEMIGKESCTRTVSKPASRKCPAGFSQSGGYSSHYSSYHGDSSPLTCSQTLSERPETVCPHGYDLSGKNCVMTTEAPREYFCPAGYEDASDECARTEYAQFLKFCAHGTMSNEGCVTYNTERPQTICPGGYKLSGSSCMAYEETPYEYYCPADYVKSEQKGTMGDCSKLVSEPVTYYCPEGTIREGEDCATYTATHPIKNCPADLEGEHCVETSYADKNAVCAAGFEMSTHTGADGGILCEKCADVHKQTSRCEYKPATLVCPPGYYKPGADKSQGCIQKTPVPFEYSCPESFDESSEKGSQLKCTKRESVPLSKSCKSDYTLVNESKSCTRMISTPQMKKCPEGFQSSSSKGGCKKVLTTAPEIVCPASYSLEGHACVETIVQAVSTKCPYSYEASGDQCAKTSTVPKLSKCPESFSDYYGKSGCKRVESAPVETICPEGYELQSGHFRHSTCTTTVTAPAEYFCTKGYAQAGQECLAKQSMPAIQRSTTEWIPKKKSKGY